MSGRPAKKKRPKTRRSGSHPAAPPTAHIGPRGKWTAGAAARMARDARNATARHLRTEAPAPAGPPHSSRRFRPSS